MKATVIEKTISFGKNRYKVDSNGRWLTLMWGWWPDRGSRPSSRWVFIPENKVPEEVKQIEV